MSLPVQFYIDPLWAKNHGMNGLSHLTLSYTFFHAKDPRMPEILKASPWGKVH